MVADFPPLQAVDFDLPVLQMMILQVRNSSYIFAVFRLKFYLRLMAADFPPLQTVDFDPLVFRLVDLDLLLLQMVIFQIFQSQ